MKSLSNPAGDLEDIFPATGLILVSRAGKAVKEF